VRITRLAAFALLLGSGAFGAAAGARDSSLPAGVPFTLDQAVATAFSHDPQLANAAARVAGEEAALLQAQGLFSRSYGVNVSAQYLVDELVGGRLRAERDRRLRLEIPPPIFEDVARNLIERLPIYPGDREPGSFLFPDCTQATSFFLIRDESTGSIQSVLCFDANDTFLGILGRGPSAEAFNAFDLTGLFDDLSAIDERLEAFVRAHLGLLSDELRVIAIALRQAAESLRLQRQRIGVLPRDLETIRLDLGFDWQHRFRSGARFVSTIDFNSTEDNYLGKRRLPAYGDSFIPNTFLATFGIGLDVPLGRGGGRVSAEAPVRAAEQNVAAARALFEQLAAQRALDTAEAYWDAAAAARRLSLLEESLATQGELLEAGKELVEAEIIPAVDLKRNQAQTAQIAAQVTAARQTLALARLELARTLGLDIASLSEAPDATEELATWLDADPLGNADIEPLIARAWANRDDARAAAALSAANATLVEAARADLRPEIALSLNLSYNAFHESFRDRFYDFEGFGRALEDKFAGPSYGISLRYRLPIGNHQARGRLLQAEAASAQSRVSELDLKRNIRQQILELARNVAQARAELASRRENLTHIEDTHAASIERYRAGDLSVIDTLTTEQERTSARLQLVDAERTYLSLIARLCFEAGSLIELPEAGHGSLAGARFRPLGESRL